MLCGRPALSLAGTLGGRLLTPLCVVAGVELLLAPSLTSPSSASPFLQIVRLARCDKAEDAYLGWKAGALGRSCVPSFFASLPDYNRQ